MVSSSYWLDTMNPQSFPTLQSTEKVDVVIIGGGITGITTAYLLSCAGFKIALIERDTIANADTGHTTAHLTYVTDSRLTKLVAELGEDRARDVWRAGQVAINEIHRIIDKLSIECDFKRVPGYLIPSLESDDPNTLTNFTEEIELAKKLDFDVALVTCVPFFNTYGLKFSDQAKFHPHLYLNGLVKEIQAQGGLIFEHSQVDRIDEDPLVVHTAAGAIHCERLVIATHTPLLGTSNLLKASLFQTKLALYTSYVIGAKIPRLTFAEGTFAEACIWDISDPYYYLRIDRHKDSDYLIFGGKDRKTGQVEEGDKIFQDLEKLLKEYAPNAQIDRRWSGQVIETTDGLPYIGANSDKQFISTGFSGNGLTFGTVAALMARDWVAGKKNAWSALFDSTRTVPISKAIEYVRENFDYPYYMVKDRLTSLKSASPECLGCEEGKLMELNGSRVAVYRDEKGKLIKLSATCPHLGGIVHWNSVEKTWDCPCHGSRFKPTGEVIAGPAEKALLRLS